MATESAAAALSLTPLSEWARVLRCPALTEQASRVLIAETGGVEVGAGRARREVQALVCSDALVLSAMRKRLTFSRKKPENTWIETANLEIEKDAEKRTLRLLPNGSQADAYELFCQTETAFETLASGLDRALTGDFEVPQMTLTDSSAAAPSGDPRRDSIVSAASALSSSSITGSFGSGPAHAASAGNNNDDNDGNQSSAREGSDTPEAEELAALESHKTDAVFDRMAMYVGSGSEADGQTADDGSKAETQSIQVFREILDSERTYVESLLRLSSEYIKPLREATARDERLITAEDVSLIFNNVEAIRKANFELLQSLQTGVLSISRNGNIPSICELAGVFAKAFVRVMPFFKMYSVYCHQYNAAVDRLSAIRESNKELAAFLSKREARVKNRQASLQSLLIKPVQRICKYPLLFRELLNHMNKLGKDRTDDADFNQHVAELCKAEKEVQAIANAVNTKVNEAEKQDQVMKAYLELGGEAGCAGLVTPSRRIVRTEDVQLREAPYSDNRLQRCRIYLFNDLVIFARLQNNGTLGKMSNTLTRSSTLTFGEKLKGTLGKSTKLKVLQRFPIEQYRGTKDLNLVDEDNRQAFELLRVSRVERPGKSGSSAGASAAAADGADGSNGAPSRTTTQIQRFQIWCDSKPAADSLMEEFEATKEAWEANGRREGASPARGRARAWANRARNRTWRASYGTAGGRQAPLEGEPDSAQGEGATAAEPGTSQSLISASDRLVSAESPSSSFRSVDGPVDYHAEAPSPRSPGSASSIQTTRSMSSTVHTRHGRTPSLIRRLSSSDRSEHINGLDEIRSKYSKTPLQLPDPDQGGTLHIDVEFPPGPLGIALENSRAPKGVLVACVAATSVAERGGIALGDRVIAVSGTPISDDATWDQIVDLIKSQPRPITITFERTEETLAAGALKSKGQSFSTPAVALPPPPPHATEPATSSGADSGPSDGDTGRHRRSLSASLVATLAGAKSATEAAAPRVPGQRQWASRRKPCSGPTMSLEDMCASYTASEPPPSEIAKTVFESLQKALDLAKENNEASEAHFKAANKTLSVLNEIYSTEEGYVCDLRKLIGEYMAPLRTARHLSAEDEQGIFLNAESILKVHAELLKSMSSKISASEQDCSLVTVASVIANELILIVPFFKMYITFCHRYSHALDRLVACRKANSAFDSFVSERENRAENKHTSLQSLLIKPVQRICKYPLLVRSLQEAVAGLETSHEELDKDLAEAESKVSNIAVEVNEKITEAVNLDKLLEFFTALGGKDGDFPELVMPHRTFIARWEVEVTKDKDNKAQRQSLLLFNDLILLVESRKRFSASSKDKEFLKLVHKLPLQQCVKCTKCPSALNSNLSATIEQKTSGSPPSSCTLQLTLVTRMQRNPGGTGSHVSTSVEKFYITCETSELSNAISEQICKAMEDLAIKEQNKKMVQAVNSPAQQNRRGGTRSWRNRNKSLTRETKKALEELSARRGGVPSS